MKFSIGDKVKLRKTSEEGVVVDIVQNQYLRVRFNESVIPVEEEDLDFPYLDWFLKDRAEAKKKKKVFIDNIRVDKSEQSAESMFPAGLYLLFQPVYRENDGEDIINRFVIYLFSEWPKALDFHLEISIRGKNLFAFEGQINFQQKQLVYSFPFEQAGDNPVFNFEIHEARSKTAPTNFFSHKLNRKKLIAKVKKLEKENAALFELAVFNELKNSQPLSLPEMGKRISGLTSLGTPKTKRKAKREIDLHIEKIEKHHTGFNDGEKLQRQIDYFHTYLDLAIADDRINPLRVIHGIGEGVLKKEIFLICNQTNEVHYYVYDKVNPGVSLIYFKN